MYMCVYREGHFIYKTEREGKKEEKITVCPLKLSQVMWLSLQQIKC